MDRVATSLLLACSLLLVSVLASDPDPLQNLCVADLNSTVSINGFACKKTVSEEDFISRLLSSVQPVTTPDVFVVTLLNVEQFPGLNTAGISLARGEMGPGAVNSPHVHPRSTEVFFLLEGKVQAGFVSSNNLFSRTLEKGNVFVFPRGLVHFQINLDDAHPAQFLAVFNSQNPGAERLGSTLFGSGISDEVLKKSFKLNEQTISQLRKEFTG
ncbi:germin-like protein subfamily T member 1 [Selaginella moellendorffii]|uniref:germin-like protein subfamily T member 1 n=1 Tax=Selaginella moellendorffii TaxID=88036 RepID=UPI000D1C7B1B|nr:germin-like protein subfamily T member 1 [Selaginella moellendorffii]|eukprot:XP_024540041.1 germin-like protein subfamily T member 1 [Selaginella moellendorffii]